MKPRRHFFIHNNNINSNGRKYLCCAAQHFCIGFCHHMTGNSHHHHHLPERRHFHTGMTTASPISSSNNNNTGNANYDPSGSFHSLNSSQYQYLREFLKLHRYPTEEQRRHLRRELVSMGGDDGSSSAAAGNENQNTTTTISLQQLSHWMHRIRSQERHELAAESDQETSSNIRRGKNASESTSTTDPRAIVSKFLAEHHFAKPTKSQFISLWNQVSHCLSRQQLYHLIWRLRQKKGVITREKRQLVRRALLKEASRLDSGVDDGDNHSNNNTYDTTQQQHQQELATSPHSILPTTLPKEKITQLQQQLKLSREQVRKIIYSFQIQTGQFTQKKKQLLSHRLKLLNYKPSPRDMDQLAQEFTLSKDQIRSFLKTLKVRRLRISKLQRLNVQRYAQSKNFILSAQDFQHLSQVSKLPEFYVKDLVRYFRANRMPLLQQHKRKLHEWLHENQYRKPTSQDLDELSHTLNMSRTKIYSFLIGARDAHCSGAVTQKKIDRIRSWMMEGTGGRDSTKGEARGHMQGDTSTNRSHSGESTTIAQLAHSLSLSVKQVRGIMEKIQHPPGEITHENQEMIQQYYERNHSKLQLYHDLPQLMRDSGLNATQIGNMIQRLKQRGNVSDGESPKITPEKRVIVLEWVKQYPEKQASDEVDHLVSETGLNRNQIQTLLWRLRKDAPQEMTEEKRTLCIQWLRENDWRMPHRSETGSLGERIGLSRSQLRRVMRACIMGEGMKEDG